MAAKAKASGLDAEWRHHALSTPPLAAASLCVAAEAASFVHHPLGVSGIVIAGAMAAFLAGALRRRAFWALIHLGVCLAFAAGWFTYTQLESATFTAPAMLTVGVALALLWPLYPVARKAERRERRADLERHRAQLRDGMPVVDWSTMLAAMGCPNLTQVGRPEQHHAGYTVTLLLPADGKVTLRQLIGLRERLEIALKLQPGWVKVERGRDASEALIHVTTRDVLAETFRLPVGEVPRSINDPIDIGVLETGETMWLTLREIVTLIVGLRGRGKSNLMNVLIARLAACCDVVLWMIDLKGGRTARPWLAPWFDERTERPVLDWVATSKTEAALMMGCALTAIQHRSHSGAGGEKIIPSARQPAILLIGEEVSALVGLHAAGSHRSTDALTSIVQLGRSEAVDAVLITQRPTVTMVGSGDLKSQVQLRIGCGFASEADARLLFNDNQMAAAAAVLRHKGTLYVQEEDARPVPGKSYRVEFGDIYPLAESVSWLRPGLEPDLEAALGEVYGQRWSEARAGHLVKGTVPVESDAAGSAPGATMTATMTATAAPSIPALPVIPPPPADAQPAWQTAKGVPIPKPFDAHEFDAEFDAIAKRLELPEDKTLHPGRMRLLGLLGEAGETGMGPTELTRRLNESGFPTTTRQTVHDWLTDLIRSGDVAKRPGANGVYILARFA